MRDSHAPKDPVFEHARAAGPGRVHSLPVAADTDDATLVDRAISGDRWAHEALYRRHVARLLNAATHILGDSVEAQDVVQETFVHCFRRLARLEDRHAFGAWMRRAVTRRAISQFRRQRLKRTFLRSLASTPLSSFARPEAPPHVVAELREVSKVLDTIAADKRAAWVLRRIEGWTLPECADATACSLATVKRRVREVDETLRKQLGDEPGSSSRKRSKGGTS